MDDDLMSLRGSSSRPDDDDDLFSSFTDPDDLGFDAGPAPTASPGGMDLFDDSPFDFNVFDEPAPAPTPPPAVTTRAAAVKAPARPKTARRTRARSRRFLGLKPQERMVLAIFLFLLVAEFGLFILLFTGAIQLPR